MVICLTALKRDSFGSNNWASPYLFCGTSRIIDSQSFLIMIIAINYRSTTDFIVF